MHFFPIIGSALLLGLLYFLLFLCALRRDIATTSIAGPAIWLLSLIAFHVGFNPREVLLYTSPPLVVALLIAALVLKQMQISTKQTLAGGLCLVGVLMLMNFRALA